MPVQGGPNENDTNHIMHLNSTMLRIATKQKMLKLCGTTQWAGQK